MFIKFPNSENFIYVRATQPATANEGDLWYNTTANTLNSFNGATWDSLGGAAGEANTSSNAGLGNGLALAKSGVDLPFKSLIHNSPLNVTVNANDLTIGLDALVNADIDAAAAIAYSKLDLATSIVNADIDAAAAIAASKLNAKGRFLMSIADTTFSTDNTQVFFAPFQGAQGGAASTTLWDLDMSYTTVLYKVAVATFTRTGSDPVYGTQKNSVNDLTVTITGTGFFSVTGSTAYVDGDTFRFMKDSTGATGVTITHRGEVVVAEFDVF